MQLALPLTTEAICVTRGEGQGVDLVVGKGKQSGRKEEAFVVWMSCKQENASGGERRADRAEQRRSQEHEHQRRQHQSIQTEPNRHGPQWNTQLADPRRRL